MDFSKLSSSRIPSKGPGSDDAEIWYFLHLCSGPDRHSDLFDCIDKLQERLGLNIEVINVDPQRGGWDLTTNAQNYSYLL